MRFELVQLQGTAKLLGTLDRGVRPEVAEPSGRLVSRAVRSVRGLLQIEDGRREAVGLFRSLVDQVTLVPENGELAFTLCGGFAGILRFAASKKNPGFLSETGVLDGLLSQGSLVAGTGFEPVTFRL